MAMASLLRETVRSLRSWRRSPGSALLVVLALGLSGGAFLTLVSLFNALLWRELPVARPEALVGITATDRRSPSWVHLGLSESLFAALDNTQHAFQGFAGYQKLESLAVINNTRQRLAIQSVSGRYFDTVGVGPELGRAVAGHDVDSASPVATISFRCWHTRFGADPSVIGQTFRLQGELVTVIGVAQRGFTGLEVGMPADAWVPTSLVPRLLNQPQGLSYFNALVGRLRPGVTLQQARTELEALWPPARRTAAESVAAAVPQERDFILSLEPHVESAARGFSQYGSFYRRTLFLLMLSCAITIVLSCANLSGLLLARWSTREGDLAVQAALGASRSRLVSQVIGESLILSMVAATLSAPLALWSAKSLALLVWNQPDVSPLDLSPDDRVLGVMVALVGVVALCVSLLPASRVWSANLTLSRGTRGSPGLSVTRWGRRLAAAQVALSVPLLVTAAIVAADLDRLERVNTGFRADGVIAVHLTRQRGAAVADSVAYFRNLGAGLREIPGVSSAALAFSEPVSQIGRPRGHLLTADDSLHSANAFYELVSPAYFQTLDVALLTGRDFAWTDDRSQRDVAIVSKGLASVLFPGADPVGRSVRLGGPSDRLLDVVGVVADAQLAEPHQMNQLFLFAPLLQQQPRPFLEMLSPVVLLKSPLSPQEVQPLAQRAIAALGRHDILNVRPLQQAVDVTLLRERVMRLGAFYFAGLTTLLVFVGLYAVLNLGVIRRIPEIGVRIALGASPHDIRRMVIREALVTAAAGLLVGVPGALVSGRLIASSLTLTGSHDAFAFGGAIALILVVTVLSVLIPLRRASRVTPVEALGTQ
jgi:predicted permease